MLAPANAARPPARPPRAGKQTIGERRDDFIGMISKEVSAEAAATTEAAAAAVLAAKASNATNGLATSTFLVCARMRPVFESELAEGGESFECVLKTAAPKETVEEVTVLLPKLSLRGDPKLEKSKFLLDHAFGQAASNDEVFAALGRPLIAKVLAGRVSSSSSSSSSSSRVTANPDPNPRPNPNPNPDPIPTSSPRRSRARSA